MKHHFFSFYIIIFQKQIKEKNKLQKNKDKKKKE